MLYDYALPARKDVRPESCWDRQRLFSDDQAWEQAVLELQALLPSLERLSQPFTDSIEALVQALDLEENARRRLERIYFYASNDFLVDATASDHSLRLGQAQRLDAGLESVLAPFESNLLSLPERTLEGWMADDRLTPYRVRLRQLQRRRAHVLTPEGEHLLAEIEPLIAGPAAAFEALTRVDAATESITLPDGRSVSIDRGNYLLLLRSGDRTVREAADTAYFAPFHAHHHTLATLLMSSIRGNIFKARARGFATALDARLFEEEIPGGVYHNLVRTVNQNLDPLHRYVALRRKTLGVEGCRRFDLRVPLIEAEVLLPYEEAVALVADSLRPLGEAYVSTFRDGLLGGWTDWARNVGKRQGGSAGTCYDVGPFISLDYRQDGESISMIAHEGGHAMHQWFSARHNPYSAFRNTIFTSEIASTVNELLLCHHLSNSANPTLQRWGLLREIELVSHNVFGQTRLAEFEWRVHDQCERGQHLDSTALQTLYAALLRQYHGPAFAPGDDDGIDALVVPHFYQAFYTYTYATGVAAACVLARRLVSGEGDAREAYIRFLSQGSSVPALEQLYAAGVDMTSPAPITEALAWFDSRLDALQALVDGRPLRQ